jgi:thymidylate synthase
MQDFVARRTGYEVGNFTHMIGSLHAYKKDLADVF